MTGYIAHHTRKKQVLARKEAALRRLIEASAPETKLLAAAGEVLDARIRVLQAKRSRIVPCGEALAHYERIDRRIETIKNMLPESVLAEFGYPAEPDSDVADS